MTIHKFFRLCSLTVASLFWASCSDSDPQLYYPQSAKLDPSEDVEESSSSEADSSSAEIESSSAESEESSSSADEPPESSSETPSSSSANSSSSDVSSSSESERYILAKDSSVTCVEESQLFPSTSCQTSSYTCDEYKEYLGKDTSVTERVLNKWEDALEFCGAISEMPSVVYGVFPPACNPNAVYLSSVLKCSNDSTYRYYQLDGNLAYRDTQEYNEAHGISSSSAPQSSSSAEPLVQSCKQEDFVLFADILADVQKALYEKIVSELLKNASLTESQTTYLEKLLDRENKTLKGNFAPYRLGNLEVEYTSMDGYSEYWFDGYIAKTKTCADGTPETTERYQEKYDSILAECLELIEKKSKASK